ncbi:hypothetical protein BpHYR1_041973 [Brachionus plicatilis]|uniref:Uncharacterized protein n=1 Tax=Brachionus plicatilis TaxID=10195 RepID=A0A3M7QCL9_BRAPC|nr:hypothetical protein BpHYR1_041973 [Brachionus plicatilis]
MKDLSHLDSIRWFDKVRYFSNLNIIRYNMSLKVDFSRLFFVIFIQNYDAQFRLKRNGKSLRNFLLNKWSWLQIIYHGKDENL